MPLHNVLGVGSPANADEAADSLSALPSNKPPHRLENAKAFDTSKFVLHHVHQSSDTTRLLRSAIEASGRSSKEIATVSGLAKATVDYARANKHNTTFTNFLRILGAAGARLYIAIPRRGVQK